MGIKIAPGFLGRTRIESCLILWYDREKRIVGVVMKIESDYNVFIVTIESKVTQELTLPRRVVIVKDDNLLDYNSFPDQLKTCYRKYNRTYIFTQDAAKGFCDAVRQDVNPMETEHCLYHWQKVSAFSLPKEKPKSKAKWTYKSKPIPELPKRKKVSKVKPVIGESPSQRVPHYTTKRSNSMTTSSSITKRPKHTSQKKKTAILLPSARIRIRFFGPDYHSRD